MFVIPKKFDPDVKDRAVRMVLERVPEAGSVTAAVGIVAPRVGDDREELRRLRVENRRLREDVEILRKASVFFAGELDPRNR